MIRDPFYQDILRGLNGKLDPELFERCASDLLRKTFPTLVPIRGGSDMGTDGAISDGEGVAYPLICTTTKDVIGNLTKNLTTYLEKGGPRRKAVLATSCSLTPKRRRNLEERANDLGFTLIQVFEQAALANLLYRSPEWCRELIGLTGQPPALSVVPRSSRPQITKQLIGRDDDLAWLVNTNGDSLLVGQPGSGKTFLLQTLAKEYGGLFLIDSNPTQIAASIRAQNPEAIIVDDAHMYLDSLERLGQLRTELRAEFRIIATCWPGHKNDVLRSMQLPTSAVRCLALLTRDQVVELVKATGITWPNELVRELVDQAEGRPGLAATLCYLCLRGDIRQVALGEALLRDTRTTFERLLGPEATAIIAAFSLGGDGGMPMDTVAAHLGLSLTKAWQLVTALAAGGVLADCGDGRLSVRPPPLRHALVRDVFFSGATSLPYGELIRRSPDMTGTTITLIEARARGAAVPDDLLHEMINHATSYTVLESFSCLGTNECQWVLENHPDRLLAIANAALRLIPQKAVPLLLDLAIADRRPLHSNPDHPLRLIADWVKSARPGNREVISRRQTLLDVTLLWFTKSVDTFTTLQALEVALSPAFSDSETDPGRGLAFTFRHGLVTPSEMKAISSFWPKVNEFLRSTPIDNWGPMFELIRSWLYPEFVMGRVLGETLSLMRDFAHAMAIDVIRMNASHPGVLSRISRMFEQFEISLSVEIDPEFEALFPINDRDKDWEENQLQQIDAADRLAQKWALEDAEDIARCMVHYEIEARAAGLTWPRWSPYVAGKIASEVQIPSIWAYALIQAGADSDLVLPFLLVAASGGDPEYPKLLETCLREPRLHSAAVSASLSAASTPTGLLNDVMSVLDDRFTNWIEAACIRREIPEDRVGVLLSHPNGSVAAAAATGIWQATPRGNIPKSLRTCWRSAVINCLQGEYWGEEIFRKDPSIAFEWLKRRIKENCNFSSLGENLLKTALQVISLEHRKSLLEQIKSDFRYSEVVAGIVDDEPEVYRILLQNQFLRAFHMAPLAGEDLSSVWIVKALLALEAGYSASDIAQAVYAVFWTWSGDESAYWARWAQSFEPLLTHSDIRIRAIGQTGRDRALTARDKALDEERLEGIYGIR